MHSLKTTANVGGITGKDRAARDAETGNEGF